MEKFLKEIEHVMIRSKKRLIKGPVGSRKGKGFGSSLDFYGHRVYSPGDDIRKIDWKAYPRTGNFYVREFTEERQMRINIILDCSASMNFGSPNKFQLAKLLSIGLAYITVNQKDMLNIYTLDNEVKILKKDLNNKEDFYQVIELIEGLSSIGRTSLDSITHIEDIREGMTFFISDLFGKKFSNALDHLSSKNQDVVVIHLMSPQEISPGFNGEFKLLDKETGEDRRILLNKETKETYKQKTNEFIDKCKKTCDYRNVKYVFSTSDIQPVNIIAKATEVV